MCVCVCARARAHAHAPASGDEEWGAGGRGAGGWGWGCSRDMRTGLAGQVGSAIKSFGMSAGLTRMINLSDLLGPVILPTAHLGHGTFRITVGTKMGQTAPVRAVMYHQPALHFPRRFRHKRQGYVRFCTEEKQTASFPF